jgi:riboflavin kinase / FMN adenylyltransferase
MSPNGCSVWVTNSTGLAFSPVAVALGKFDGLHRGHQRVIQPILKVRETKEAKDLLISPASLNSPASEDKHVYSTVVTFNPHPQEFFSGKPRALLTPLDEKVQQLRSLGVEQLVLLPFDRQLCSLTPEEFVEKILVEQLQTTQVSVGHDFHFGSQRSGTAENLQAIAARYNIPVTIVPLETEDSDSSLSPETTPISTSFIRKILDTGDVERAKQLLGRAYSLTGTVTKGQQLGRTIGFPTANLELPQDKFLPRLGVYAVRICRVNDTSAQLEPIAFGVMNIGNRPTINGLNTTIEVHLFDWDGDLYGQKLAVHLEKFIRPETKFSSLEALKSQIQEDCIVAKVFFDSFFETSC